MSREGRRRAAGIVVWIASALVPREERERWRNEWWAEIAFRESRGRPSFARSWGAVPHALWHRRQSFRWDALSLDSKHAVRTLARRPGFVIAASITLAAGIGATTAVFSVVDAVLLRPLAYTEPERLVFLWEVNEENGGERAHPAPANLLDFRRESRTLAAVGSWWIDSETILADGDGEAEEVPMARVTADFFRAFAVPAALGRTFSPEEVSLGARVTVLSHELWERRFGGDPSVVGRDIRLEQGSWRVLGVMPASFRTPGTLPGEVQLFEPWDFGRHYSHLARVPRDHRFVRTAARLAPDATIEQAQAELSTIAEALARVYPDTNHGWGVDLVPLHEAMVGGMVPVLLVLTGAVAFVLLLACANVAGLLLLRASARSREMAVRTALGASRLRLVRQLFLETLLLAAAGGAVGIGLAWASVELLSRAAPAGIFRIEETSVDARVLAFATVLSVTAGIASGLVPAFQSSTKRPAEGLKASGAVVSPDRKRQRARTMLVVVEVAAAVLLLVGAALFLRSLSRLLAVDPGFRAENLLVARMRLDGETYGRGGAHLYYTELLARLRELPGVTHAGGITALPMDPVDVDFERPYWRDGEPRPPGGGPGVGIRMPTVGYFETMRIPILSGRLFDERDDRSRPRVVLVNETMARRTWPGESPLGKRLRLDYLDVSAAYEIVGVVGDTRFDGYRSAPSPEVYIPHAQNPYLPMNLVLRYESSAEALAPLVRATILSVDASQPVHSMEDMADLVGADTGRDRFTAFLMVVFGSVALLLATIGLYGVVAQSVSERQRELGLRMALGADRGSIAGLVLGSGVRIATVGGLLGIALMVPAARVVRSVLFEISPVDPTSIAAGVGLSLATVLAASYLPARRASRLDPTTTLRSD